MITKTTKPQAAPQPQPVANGQQRGVSMSPATFTQGGLIDDCVVTIKDAAYCLFDYGGKSDAGPAPALGLTMVPDGPGATEVDQYWSAGDKKYFMPSEDGRFLLPVGTKQGISEGCNLAILIKSLLEAQYPVERLETGDAQMFVGCRFHVVQQAAPKRAGIIRTGPRATREQTVLVVDRLVKLPHEAADRVQSTAPSTSPVTQPQAATGAAVQGAQQATNGTAHLDAEATDLVMQIIIEAGVPVARATLPQAVFAKVGKENANRAGLAALIYSDAFLKAPGKPWKFDGALVSM